MHKVSKDLTTPVEKIRICVIGAGGTGSYVLQGLAKIHLALPELVHNSKGITVDVYDPDVVSNSNVCRQLYRDDEVGDYKAKVLVSNINRYYGYNWRSIPEKFDNPKYDYNIFIICVDSMSSRREIYKLLEEAESRLYNFYVVDYGNGKDFGQVLLSQYIRQPLNKFARPWDLPKGYLDIEDDEEEPSCSIAQALSRQKMFINPTIANIGLDLIFDLLTKPIITKQEVYLDLNNGKMVSKEFPDESKN